MRAHSRIIPAFLAAVLCLSSAGCAVPILLAVGAGAVGGYAVSRDTFEGVTAKTQDEIWDAAVRVCGIMGMVEYSDKRGGLVNATINGAKVTVNVIQVSLTTTKLRIKARKGIFPAISTAQEVYGKIMNQTEQ